MAKKKQNTKDSANKKGGRAPKAPAAPVGRFGAHRPLYERILFGLALAGILVTAHLNIWYGAEQVTDDPVCGVGFDCQAVLASDPMPLGVPSAVWGLLFYLGVAGICAGSVFLAEERRLLLKKVRAGMIGVGFLYSLFLTAYQFFVLSDRCLLCLISASIIAAMTVVLAMYLWQATPQAQNRKTTPAPTTAYKLYGALVVLALVLVGADYAYFSSQDLPAVARLGGTVPVAEDAPVDVSQCRFDTEKPYYSNMNMLVGEDDPIQGNPDAPVTIIEFIDPNCPHCRTVHPVIKAIGAKYPDQVRIVYKPVAIVGSASHSVEEVAALLLANEVGKFTEMLEFEFSNQTPRQGLSLKKLGDYAEQLGLDAAQFRTDITEGRLNPKIQRNRRIYQELGLSGVPTVILEGRVVHSRSRSVGCMSHFIEQELATKGRSDDEATAEEEPVTASEEEPTQGG